MNTKHGWVGRFIGAMRTWLSMFIADECRLQSRYDNRAVMYSMWTSIERNLALQTKSDFPRKTPRQSANDTSRWNEEESERLLQSSTSANEANYSRFGSACRLEITANVVYDENEG